MRLALDSGTRSGGARHFWLPNRGLLQFDGGACALELGLGLLGVLLGRLLEHRLRRAVDQVLGLLEAEVGEGAHLLDDLNLLVAGSGEDDVELVLLLGCARAVAAATGGGCRAGNRDRSRGDRKSVV